MKLILTEDGSHTIYVPELDETYHSIHGAIQESEHVFIKHGLSYFLDRNVKPAIAILEIGFGTGLNALLSNKAGQSLQINYISLEKYPLEAELTDQLNYGQLLNTEEIFQLLHRSAWDTDITISKRFTLRKIATDFTAYESSEKVDIIYFDAFAPSKQPDMWQKAHLAKCYNLLNEGGVFVTYSAKGQLKRDLVEVGFTIESLPGPPGKFEMTRATR